MPPYGSYGLPPQQGRAPQFQQPYQQPMTQPPSPAYGGYGSYGPSGGQTNGYVAQPPMPYGPPPAQSGPLYGAAPAGALANTPPDPYAWQRGAVQTANGVQPALQQYQSPRPATITPTMPAMTVSPQSQSQPMSQAFGQPAQVRQYAAQPQAQTQMTAQPQTYGQPQTQFSPAFQPQPGMSGQQPGVFMQQYQDMSASNPMQQASVYGAYQQGPARRRRPKLDLRMFVNRLLNHPKQSMIAGGVAAGAIILVVGLTIATNSGSGRQSSSSINILGGAASKLAGGQSADQLFQTALGNALQTKSYDLKVTGKTQTIERKVDVSNTKAPKLSGSAKVADIGMEFEAYATRDDTFVKLSKASILAGKPSMANQWVQVRRGGVLLNATGTGGASLDMLFTPTVALYNGFIFGNYSSQERSTLLSIIKDQLVYRYDPSTVKETNLNGQQVLQYQVTVSSSGQESLSAKAAQLAGVDQARIIQGATIARLSGAANAKFIVSVSSDDQRIIQIIEDGGADAATYDFSAYDATKPSQAPKPVYTWDDYANRLK